MRSLHSPLTTTLTFLLFILQPPVTNARQCGPGEQPCVAFIRQDRLPSISAQQTLVWCWAASAQAIFRYYGHNVEQSAIVQQTFQTPFPVITTANAYTMIRMLNSTYIDNNGQQFVVRTPRLYDAHSWLSFNPLFMQSIGAVPLNNNDILTQLQAERPLLICSQTHAMVLTAMTYHIINGLVSPVGGWVLDPAPAPANPQQAVGLRQLMPNEMQAFFAAEVVVANSW